MLVSACYELNSCWIPKIHIEALISNVMVTGDGALRGNYG